MLMAEYEDRNRRFCQADALQATLIFNLFPRKTGFFFWCKVIVTGAVCTSKNPQMSVQGIAN